MPSRSHDDHDLPAPGRRWGAGASSVLPYLARSLQAKPTDHPDAGDARSKASNPVFAEPPRKRNPPR